MAKRPNRKGHETEQEHDCRVNRCRESKRGNNSPKPLRRRERTASESKRAGAAGSHWWTATARPPEVEHKENYFDSRSRRHAKAQEQWRPHVRRNKGDDDASNDSS